ncbi:MAG: response regulator [Candidatus Omnitrophica bacterium]|nr:response regulator [Candidatus Omnitrophota bacterium]
MARVLIVDDDTAVRELVYDALSAKGHQVLAAGSGPQLFELLKTQRADLILMDVSMPKTSGQELAKKLRTLDDAVPIVMLRAPSDPELTVDDRECIRCRETLLKEPAEAFLVGVERILAAMSTSANRAGTPTAGVKATILTVDDDEAARKMAKLIFERRGFRIIQAASGEEALKVLETERPKVVLLDLTMPGMDGLMTLKKIKAGHPAVPVIIVSGRGENDTVREALRAGAYDFVTKPFSIEYLESTVMTKLLVGLEGGAA